MDYFQALEIFGLEPSAGEDATERKYRELAKLYHPDNAEGSAEKMALVNVAYGILTRHSRAVSNIITTGIPNVVREQVKQDFENKRKAHFEAKINPLLRLRRLTAVAALVLALLAVFSVDKINPIIEQIYPYQPVTVKSKTLAELFWLFRTNSPNYGTTSDLDILRIIDTVNDQTSLPGGAKTLFTEFLRKNNKWAFAYLDELMTFNPYATYDEIGILEEIRREIQQLQDIDDRNFERGTHLAMVTTFFGFLALGAGSVAVWTTHRRSSIQAHIEDLNDFFQSKTNIAVTLKLFLGEKYAKSWTQRELTRAFRPFLKPNQFGLRRPSVLSEVDPEFLVVLKRVRRVFRGVTREPAFLSAMLVDKGVELGLLEFQETLVGGVPETRYHLKIEAEEQLHGSEHPANDTDAIGSDEPKKRS